MISKLDLIRRRIGVFSVVWIVITSGGVYFNSLSVTPFTLIFDVFLVLTQFIVVKKAMLTPNRLALLASLGVCVVLSIAFNSDYSSLLSYARLLLIILLAFGASLLVENEVIAKTFVKVVVLLAAISVLLFYTEIVDRNVGQFPVIQFYEYRYVNAFVYLFFDSIEQRNLSIFIEPGLYQIYLNISLFILLYGENKYRYGYIAVIILLVAIFSTKSTTGYILGLMIVGGRIFYSGLKKEKFITQISKASLLFLMIFMVLMSDYFSSNIVEKFAGGNQMSFEYRKNASIIDYLLILENPFMGIGIGNYMSQLAAYNNSGLSIDASANTFSQIGALIGLPFLGIVLWRLSVFVRRLNTGSAGKWIFAAVFIIAFSTEPFVLYPLFYLPVFMSYRDWKFRLGSINSFGNHENIPAFGRNYQSDQQKGLR